MKILNQQEFINSQSELSELLYHGSTYDFAVGVPYPVSRGQINLHGEVIQTYNSIGFQCADQLYIALAYTYTKQIHNTHNIGVSLYENNNTIVVVGPDCLEDSWSRLYGNTDRCLYCFAHDNFIQEEGLGSLEYKPRIYLLKRH